MKTPKNLILPLMVILVICTSCGGLKKKAKPEPESAEQSLMADVTYSKYQTAMGAGKGIVFQLQFTTKGALQVESIFIGNKRMEFTMLANNPLKFEINYLINKEAPSPEYPNPILPHDDIIDDKNFQPAWVNLTLDGKPYRIQLIDFKEMSR